MVDRKKHTRKVSLDSQFYKERLTTVNDFNRQKIRTVGASFDAQSTKDLSSVQIRSTSAIKSAHGFNKVLGFQTLTHKRQRELADKYSFSKSEIEIYGKICMKMKNFNEREKSNFISMILEKSSL